MIAVQGARRTGCRHAARNGPAAASIPQVPSMRCGGLMAPSKPCSNPSALCQARSTEPATPNPMTAARDSP
jgi:hypothetical protein